MTNPYLWDRLAGREDHLRAADADRERVAERLRTSHAEGRLDLTEFQERLERCYAARTFGELAPLVGDLPRQDASTTRPRVPWRLRLSPVVLVLLAIVAIAAAGAHHHSAWVWIPLWFLIVRMFVWRHRRWTVGPRRRPGGWL